MAKYVVSTGIVDSWVNHTSLISTGAKPSSATWTQSTDAANVTVGGAQFEEKLAGLSSVAFQIETRFESAYVVSGSSDSTELVTFANGNDTNVEGWELNITRPAVDLTDGGSADPVVWRDFDAGLASWAGSYTVNADDGTAESVGPLSGAASFLMREDTTTDHTLSGNITVTGVPKQIAIGQKSALTYSFDGSGDLSIAGEGAETPILTAGVLAFPITGALTVTSVSGKTESASAFVTGLTIRSRIGEPLTLSITAQGTGAFVASQS